MKKSTIITLIKITVSVILLGLLVLFTDFAALVAAFRGFSWPWALVALGLVGVSVLISAIKWGVLVDAQGLSAKLPRLYGTYTAGLFFNNFLPSSIGGDGVRILLHGKHTGNTPGITTSVVLERALATVSLGLLGLVAALFTPYPNILALVILGAVAVLGIIISVLILTGWLPRGIRQGSGKISRFLQGFAGSASVLAQKPQAVLISLLLSFLFQISVALVMGAVLIGTGVPFPGLLDIIYTTSAASVLAMVPIGLNGYGLREGAFAFLLAPYGIPGATAITTSVLFALIVSLFSLWGGIYWALDTKKGQASLPSTT